MIDYDSGNPPVEHDYTHPERHFKGLAPRFNGNPFPEEFERLGWRESVGWGPQVELCWACGWSTYEQSYSGYAPRIRIMHARDNGGLWSIGSKWLIRDQPNNNALGNDYMTWEFLQKQPDLNIPLVKEMRILNDPAESIQFTLISRAQGQTLESIWPTLSPEQKSGYRDQMVDILKQLRQFTAPFPQKVNGDKLDDCLLTICHRRRPPTCFQIGFTEDEWLEAISEDLRCGLHRIHKTKDPKVIEEKLQEIKNSFPRGGPYVLTHGDLNLSNIIVKDDKIEAIIDWEVAGFYPWWAETYRVAMYGGMNMNDLFRGVWPRVHPFLGGDAFQELIQKLRPLRQAFDRGGREHVAPEFGFWLPPFCKCKPYGGMIKGKDLGVKTTHRVLDWANDEMPGCTNSSLT